MSDKELLNEILRSVVEYYGTESQERQLIEEMAELTQVLNKKWRIEEGYIEEKEDIGERLAEEIADVIICIQQVILINNLEEKVSEYILMKLSRTINRIKEELRA